MEKQKKLRFVERRATALNNENDDSTKHILANAARKQ